MLRLFIGLLFTAAMMPNANRGDASAVVRSDTVVYRIDKAIPPSHRAILNDSAWLPTDQDAEKVLHATEKYLCNLNKELKHIKSTDDGSLDSILVHLGIFNVQIIGEIRIEKTIIKKVILCKFFPRTMGDRFFLDWKTNILGQVLDGGWHYWEIYYDPTTDACMHLHVNGTA
jgi:hypothetical protein